VLLIAAALVLVVTCANVANLLLARASVRMREVAVRRALGASTARIARQLWTEALVLTVAGTAVGLALAWLALRALVTLAPLDVPRLTTAALDARALAFTTLVAGLVAIVFGGVSALRLRGFGIRAALHALPGRSTEGRGARQARAALVVGQVALAVVLFAAAGLLLRSYTALQAVDPGFRTTGVLKVEYEVRWSRYGDRREDWPDLRGINGFHANVVASIGALPGVVAAGLAARHPLDPGYTNSFVIIGREAESSDFPEIRTRFMSPGYLSATGVPLIAGRDIGGGDVATSPRVGLINRAAVERYFSGVDPLGQQLRLRGFEWRVVGVIGNERFKGIDQESEPAIYVPLAQMPQSPVTLLVRTTRDPLAIAPQVRRTLRELDPEIPLFGVEPLERTVAATIAPQRFTTTLLSVFSAVTVLLALIGVHGLLAYTVTQRTRELGIRMALGATQRDIRLIVLRQGMGLAVIGVVIGLVAALLGTRLVATMLFDVTPTDPATFALVTIAVLVTAAGAAWLPARRATTVDPVEALRD
jgi:predicted permease